ncbi:hypothetical protein BC834DRAFT_119019 [Gloeopeniophorella convolvens]|nr:hypothetical protein BC834DRAFT_119019 [Gloeopeniophorella convolvens]
MLLTPARSFLSITRLIAVCSASHGDSLSILSIRPHFLSSQELSTTPKKSNSGLFVICSLSLASVYRDLLTFKQLVLRVRRGLSQGYTIEKEHTLTRRWVHFFLAVP